MNLSIDPSLIISIGLAVLGLNVVCLIALLVARGGAGVAPGELSRSMLAEGLGAFALVFIGILSLVGGVIAGGEPGGQVQVAFAHGLTLTVCLAALGRRAVGYFNPAVSLGVLCAGRLSVVSAFGAVAAQFAGGTSAAALLAWLFGPEALGPAVASPGVPLRSAFVLEAVATFVLVLVVFGASIDRRAPRAVAPAAIGSAMTVGMLALSPLTGGVLNPVRYFAAAVVGGRLDAWLVYMAGPAIGAVLAAVLMQLLLLEEAAHEADAEAEPETEEYRPRQAA